MKKLMGVFIFMVCLFFIVTTSFSCDDFSDKKDVTTNTNINSNLNKNDNTNRNTNTNNNLNTNINNINNKTIVGSHSYATSESSLGNLSSSSNNSNNVSITNPNDVHYSGVRSFPQAPEINYPSMAPYGTQPTNGPSVTNLTEWLKYGNVFDVGTLNNMVVKDGLDFLGFGGYKVTTVAETNKVETKPTTVKVLLKSQVNQGTAYKRAATITVKASNLNTTSEKLLAVAALEAVEYGASEIHVIDDGKMRVINSSGWGIGLYYHGSSLSSSETSGTSGGGGTGYSTSEAGYQDKPWLKVLAILPIK